MIENKEIIILISMGKILTSYLKDGEGKMYSREIIQYCWKYLEKKEFDLEYLYDSIDSPDEIDFTYYESMTDSQQNKEIYRYLFDIVAYITKKISIEESVTIPQYLDYIHNDFYDELLNRLVNKYFELRNLMEEVESIIVLKENKLTQSDFETIINKYI